MTMTRRIIAGLRKKTAGIALMAMSVGISFALQTSAQAGPALLLDANTGRVLYEEQAGQPWYPASVTKLMTTYLVLKEINEGRLSLHTPLKVSANANKVQPSRMGFKPGTVVTIDNALKMMLVKSANDLAVVLAEGVAGSVEGFTAAMNVEARRLGMDGSNFTNPHGLYDPLQKVTARDMAILARALLNDFPQYRPYYGIGGVKLGNRTFYNTNGLIGRYPGAEGMKTGFICASGFNVVATANRGNQQLIAVLLGERNASARTIRAARLFDMGFSGAYAASGQVEDIPLVMGAATPDIREEVCGQNRNNLADDDNAPTLASAAGDGVMLASLIGAAQTSFTPIEGERRGTLIKRAETTPLVVFTGLEPGPHDFAPPPGTKTNKGKKASGTVRAFAETEKTSSAQSGSASSALQGAIKPVKSKATKSNQATAKKAAPAKNNSQKQQTPKNP